MLTALYIILITAIAVGIITLIWRVSSKRSSIPCPAWLGLLVEMENPVFRNNHSRTIIKNSEIEPGMKVLDFGCGPGRVTIPTAIAVGPTGSVSALDIQADMLEKVRIKAEKADIYNIEYLRSAAGEGKLGEHRYDRVLLVNVIGEIPDWDTALKEIFNSLKPGGILSVTEVIADPHFQTGKKVTVAAEKAGFIKINHFGSPVSYTALFEKPGFAT